MNQMAKGAYTFNEITIAEKEEKQIELHCSLLLFVKGGALKIDSVTDLKKDEMLFIPEGRSLRLSSQKGCCIAFLSILKPQETYNYSSYPLTQAVLIKEFIETLSVYSSDGLLDKELMFIKTAELFYILRLSYKKEELLKFFGTPLPEIL